MSSRAVWVAGTGRMGRDIGLWCLAHGFDVTWVSRDAARLEAFRSRLARDLRRMASQEPPAGNATFLELAAVDGTCPPVPDVVVETIQEDPDAKRRLLDVLVAGAGSEALVLSNSSSLLPSSLHPRCLGAHFFYPIALTGFVEAVVPDGALPGDAARLQDFLAALGLATIRQDESRAFAVNRLLLPLQDACFRMLVQGAAAADIDAAVTPFLGTGPLALMDAVGLDVMAAAVSAYRARMEPRAAADLAPLSEVLSRLVASGKLGRKNGDGLLCGSPLPWAGADGGIESGAGELLGVLFRLTCRRAVAARELDAASLNVALAGLFGVQYAPDSTDVHDASVAARMYGLTGLSYWRPVPDGAGQVM